MSNQSLRVLAKTACVQLKKLDPSFQLQIRKNWGSQYFQNRQRIREWILFSTGGNPSLRDLNSQPQLSDGLGYCSISHTLDLGVAVVARDCRVGVDVEIRSRIKPEVIARVCTPEEIQIAKASDILWTLKEASFKAASHKLMTLKEIQLKQVEAVSKHIFYFETQVTVGYVFRESKHCLALAAYKDERNEPL